jgi:hypothetical protein
MSFKVPVALSMLSTATVRINVDAGPRNADKSRKERETCHEKKILSELVHF